MIPASLDTPQLIALAATTRAAINTSPEPFSNVAASLVGDAAVPAMLWLAFTHPAWFAVALVMAVVVSVWLTLRLLKFLKSLVRGLRGRLGGASTAA